MRSKFEGRLLAAFMLTAAGLAAQASPLDQSDTDSIGNRHVRAEVFTSARAAHTSSRTDLTFKGRHEINVLNRAKILSSFEFDANSQFGGECLVKLGKKVTKKATIAAAKTTAFELPKTVKNAFTKKPSKTFSFGGIDVVVAAQVGLGAEAATNWTLAPARCDVQGTVRQWAFVEGSLTISPISSWILSVGVEVAVDLMDRKATLAVADTANGLAHVDIKIKRLAWRLLVKLFAEIGGGVGPRTEFLTVVDRAGGERSKTLL